LGDYNTIGLNIGVHQSTSDFIDGFIGSSEKEDMYFITMIEYSGRILENSIYNQNGRLRSRGLFKKKPFVYTEKDYKRQREKEADGLSKKERRKIKRYLRKIKRKRK